MFLFVVDASGSMGARERMRTVKGVIFKILMEAYQKRDKVGMIAFRKNKAEVLLPVTRSVDVAKKKHEPKKAYNKQAGREMPCTKCNKY